MNERTNQKKKEEAEVKMEKELFLCEQSAHYGIVGHIFRWSFGPLSFVATTKPNEQNKKKITREIRAKRMRSPN